MILALSRNLVPADHSMKEGRWDRKLYRGHELSEKILGIIGFGRIGQEVAHRMRAFDMSIIAFDPLLTVEKAASFGASKVSLADIWKLSDYITVHVPLLPQTKSE
ncbi:hypothetical protein QAD02_013822 [Eretmocerus hayati]|uniref:Uncharacterized protein n=1 Tax=Eretmocerus hayati TaxID=131215 RepID=A0ACC2P3S9_9HYME|nr:hypothetical protein QAD02_013822 [Eretmocerus hayati]